MPHRRNSNIVAGALLGAGLCAALGACGASATPEAPPEAPLTEAAAARPALGLMTSLPLYWPLGADSGAIASGRAAVPWQRSALEQAFSLTPLDTLSPMPGLAADAPEVDPLAGLHRLAVIQPRGLSPADNVALDTWVQGGGRLLLVLDPMLTGEYDLPLGDPRRPAEVALIPPVVARWGMKVSYAEPDTEAGVVAASTATLPDGRILPLADPGTLALLPEGKARCTLAGKSGVMATCRIGKGTVTLIADAALFEHPELAGENGTALRALVAGVLE